MSHACHNPKRYLPGKAKAARIVPLGVNNASSRKQAVNSEQFQKVENSLRGFPEFSSVWGNE